MQLPWRVACVRIPRFPIAAVWRARERQPGMQLSLELSKEVRESEIGNREDGHRPPADTNAVAQSRSMDANGWEQGNAPEPGERRSASWDDRPLALAENQILRTVSSGAARARVQPGMRVAAARALCAELEVLPWDDTIITDAVNALTAELIPASPQVTPVQGEPGLWWIGASGLDGVGGEHELARALLDVARRWHPRARMAVADSCVTARAATWSSRHHAVTIVKPGGDADYLAPAPLALLPMEGELRDTFGSLGITTAGGIAQLDAEDVERRWGDAGLAVWRLARGEDDRRPGLTAHTVPREVSAELPSSVMTLDPVLFLVRPAIERLAHGLAADGRSAATIAVTLTLDDRRSAMPNGAPPHTITREVRFPRPTARAASLFEQCRALLERWPLTAPVSAVRVAVVATAASSGEQGDLLATRWRDPAAVDAALARLRAELGPETVVRAVERDDWRPEREGEWREEERGRGTGTGIREPGPGSRSPDSVDRAFRLLETPEEIQIERADGLPAALWWRGERLDLARAEGPERLSGEWWQDRYSRDYWRCTSERGSLLVYRDGTERWYVQGWVD